MTFSLVTRHSLTRDCCRFAFQVELALQLKDDLGIMKSAAKTVTKRFSSGRLSSAPGSPSHTPPQPNSGVVHMSFVWEPDEPPTPVAEVAEEAPLLPPSLIAEPESPSMRASQLPGGLLDQLAAVAAKEEEEKAAEEKAALEATEKLRVDAEARMARRKAERDSRLASMASLHALPTPAADAQSAPAPAEAETVAAPAEAETVAAPAEPEPVAAPSEAEPVAANAEAEPVAANAEAESVAANTRSRPPSRSESVRGRLHRKALAIWKAAPAPAAAAPVAAAPAAAAPDAALVEHEAAADAAAASSLLGGEVSSRRSLMDELRKLSMELEQRDDQIKSLSNELEQREVQWRPELKSQGHWLERAEATMARNDELGDSSFEEELGKIAMESRSEVDRVDSHMYLNPITTAPSGTTPPALSGSPTRQTTPEVEPITPQGARQTPPRLVSALTTDEPSSNELDRGPTWSGSSDISDGGLRSDISEGGLHVDFPDDSETTPESEPKPKPKQIGRQNSFDRLREKGRRFSNMMMLKRSAPAAMKSPPTPANPHTLERMRSFKT